MQNIKAYPLSFLFENKKKLGALGQSNAFFENQNFGYSPAESPFFLFALKGDALEDANVSSNSLARNDFIFLFVYYFHHKKDDLMIMKKGKAEIPSIDIGMRND